MTFTMATDNESKVFIKVMFGLIVIALLVVHTWGNTVRLQYALALETQSKYKEINSDATFQGEQHWVSVWLIVRHVMALAAPYLLVLGGVWNELGKPIPRWVVFLAALYAGVLFVLQLVTIILEHHLWGAEGVYHAEHNSFDFTGANRGMALTALVIDALIFAITFLAGSRGKGGIGP